MFDKIADYFITEPHRIDVMGEVLFRLGAALIFAGVVAHFATTAVSVVTMSMPNSTHVPQSLADLLPGIPTWWIPESIVGGLPAAGLCGLGFWLKVVAKKIRRVLA